MGHDSYPIQLQHTVSPYLENTVSQQVQTLELEWLEDESRDEESSEIATSDAMASPNSPDNGVQALINKEDPTSEVSGDNSPKALDLTTTMNNIAEALQRQEVPGQEHINARGLADHNVNNVSKENNDVNFKQ